MGAERPPVQAEACAWFFENFAAATPDELDELYPREPRAASVRRVPRLLRGAGVLVSRGLLHEDVYFDAPFALELVWAKVAGIIDEMREKLDPAAWENVAWLGKRHGVWSRERWRAKLDAVPVEQGPA